MTREPAAAPRITVLAAAHAPAYKALRDEALRCAPEAFTSDYATAVQRPAQSYAPRLSMPADEGFFLGAWDADGALLGSIGCQREERAQQRHMATVVAMMVAPQAQRRGIGRQLLRACLAQAERMAGLEQLVLTVTAGNAHAVRLYQRAGFTPYGLLPRAIVVAGVGHDKLHMLRLLPSSPLWQPIAPHEDH
ncbi:GNAT family N-acetyltransferase [Alicycliphilus denitrificans]|uniref:GCN5-related N-acetyltransferase n=2 Tax=Alicycliphilus denitrificans TaxID=179636 RepID=F4G7G2_ALIDK|nr:GNAT family N-acetyltransferase [Alicycliphilus denitrificans]ADU99493.1 GCN5-related N-acetyltransferase [Alicycliphilus denitrificans BC]AEB85492.1 GCN5-related N-acetyltransferase [Alicycliphilus denitrificans K601]QKD43696.1 GNAT family N-acetyltransferase [Alicycliphilus denitrificans]GAO22760.1 N-acetyltransferase GCN5 [Alicycliphilus sp. B1]